MLLLRVASFVSLSPPVSVLARRLLPREAEREKLTAACINGDQGE